MRGYPFAILGATLASSIALGDTTPSSNTGTGLEEVVVTAQRREQSLQTVPIAVSAYTSEDMQSRQITSAIDVARTVPNLLGHSNTGTATANTYFLRGLGSTEQIATIDPAVGTYVDDVIVPRTNANNYALFDVERVEVLRGPQGTTFGRNTTGGAISIITRRPGTELGGYLTVGGGSFSRELLRGSIDIPVSSKVLTKFSGFYLKDDGWLYNQTNGQTLNSTNNYGGRAAFRLLPSDNVTWDLIGEYIVADGVYLRSNLGVRDDTNTIYTTNGATGNVVNDMLNKRGLRNDTSSVGVISNLGWRINDSMTLNAITGYRAVDQQFVLDFSLARENVTPGPFGLNNDGMYDMFSQEFKLTGNFGASIDYVAGLYYFYEDNTTKAGQTFAVSPSATLTLSCSVGLFGDGNTLCPTATGPKPGYSSWRDIRNTTNSFAVYAQADWRFYDRWTAVLGARYTDETKDVNLKATQYGGMTTSDLKAAGIPTSLDASIVTPKVGINFQANDETMVYASATRGFKSGGWNSRTAYLPQQFQAMDPEKTWSYELGTKSQMLNNTLRVNAAAFYAQTNGLQLSYTTPGPIPGTVLSTQDNAGDIDVYGFELEFVAMLTENLSAYGSVGLQHGEYTKVNPRAQSFCTNGGTVVNGKCANPKPPFTTTSYTNAIDKSDDLSRLPNETVALGINWDFPVPELRGTLHATVEGDYNSGYWTTASNSTPTLRLTPDGPLVTPTALDSYAQSFTLMNIAFSYTSSDNHWQAVVDCKNCTDATYLVAVFNGDFYGEPRRLSGSLTYKF